MVSGLSTGEDQYSDLKGEMERIFSVDLETALYIFELVWGEVVVLVKSIPVVYRDACAYRV